MSTKNKTARPQKPPLAKAARPKRVMRDGKKYHRCPNPDCGFESSQMDYYIGSGEMDNHIREVHGYVLMGVGKEKRWVYVGKMPVEQVEDLSRVYSALTALIMSLQIEPRKRYVEGLIELQLKGWVDIMKKMKTEDIEQFVNEVLDPVATRLKEVKQIGDTELQQRKERLE